MLCDIINCHVCISDMNVWQYINSYSLQNNITSHIIILGFYLLCLGFKNLYIAVLFVFLVGWCKFLFMVILFWTFYILGIKFFRIDLKNLDHFLMKDDFSCMNNSNPIFFKVWIFFDWYGLQWILPVDFQSIHPQVLQFIVVFDVIYIR